MPPGDVEQVGDARGFRLLDDLRQDLRHAARMLARSPGFTAVASLSLALGIGANSAVFSLADALLLRPLPVRDPDAVVSIGTAEPGGALAGRVSYPNYRDLLESRSFASLVAHRLSTFSFARSPQAVREMRMGVLVSDNFFSALGVQPALGRGFLPAEGTVAGRAAVVVLGYDFWMNALGADRSMLDRVVSINGIEFTVVGVAPEAFTGLDQFIRPAFYVPAIMSQALTAGAEARGGDPVEDPIENRMQHSFGVKGRLKPGVSQRGAQTELATIWMRLQQQYPDANRNRAIAVRSELESRVLEALPLAVLAAMLMALVALVLVIACANVANLLLGRARGRSREIAIRLALGVGRMRLLRQLLTESLLLALIGAGGGLVVAHSGIRFLQKLQIPSDLPILIAPRLDLRMLFFTLTAAVASAVLFGLAPAWQSLKTAVVPALKSSEPGQAVRRKTIGRNALVVAQVALSMVLLVAGAMILDGFRRSLLMSPGFRTDHLIMLATDTSLVRYTPVQTRAFYRQLLDRANALPGVRSVALTSAVPLEGWAPTRMVIPEGYRFPAGQEGASVLASTVDEHYLGTMNIAMIRGRAFAADDTDSSRRVAIVNEEFAKSYWPNQDPIGKRLQLNDNRGAWLEVVGVARTGKYLVSFERPKSFLYLPFSQHGGTAMTLLVETTNPDAAPLAGPLRDVIRALDLNQPIYNVRLVSSFFEQRAIAMPLTIVQAVGAMGVVGLTLALIGLSGLVGYSVARRTREIGIRMAIGASQQTVMKMVLAEGLVLSIAGILVGGVASVAVARLLTAALIGVGTPNPASFVIVPVMLIALTAAATYLPARRAARVDPLRALRHE